MEEAPPVEFAFLEDRGQSADGTAALLTGFLAEARSTLEIAIYDMRLAGAPAQLLLEAVKAAAARGVMVRIVFNQDHPKKLPVPPPSEVDWDLVKQMGVPFRPISGVPDLMHHKYVVRDANAVWTGSANWTTDSWTREENVIVRVVSAELAAAYRQDFEELGARIRPFFSPGRGQKMSHEIAHRVAAAQRRVRVASPVITSGPVLGTLAELISDPRADLRGIYDRTQMDEVQRQWSQNGLAGWKLEAFKTIAASGRFASKVTTPYSKGSVHDFMHAKLTVADDTVFVGSYNLSHSGEMNAENVLEIESAPLADLCSTYIEKIMEKYGAAIPT